MHSFLHVWPIIAPVALVIAFGYLCKKFSFRIDIETLSNLIIYVGSPCLIFSVITQQHILWREYSLILTSAFTVMLGCGLITYAILKMLGRPRLKGFYIPVMLMNTGNIGFPIALFAYGQEGFARAIVYDLGLLIVMYSVGVAILAGRKHLFDGLKLPALHVAAISILIAAFKIPVPPFLLHATTMLGNITIPLMMLLLGYRLCASCITSWGLPLLGALIRTGGGLLIAYAFLALFPVPDITRKIILLYSALPSAMMSYVLTEKYRKDQDIAASTVVISTFASIVYIPVILFFI